MPFPHLRSLNILAVEFALAVALVSLGGATAGCAKHAMPTVTVGDPAVFTTLHLVAADRAYRNDAGRAGDTTGAELGVSTLGHLHRYFGTTPEEYKKLGRRMDVFLDQTQRSQAFALILARRLQLEVQYNEDGLKDPSFAASSPADAASAQPRFSAGGQVASTAQADASRAKVDAAKAKLADAEKKLAATQALVKLYESRATEKSAAMQAALTTKAEETAAAETKQKKLDELQKQLAALPAGDAGRKPLETEIAKLTPEIETHKENAKKAGAVADANKSEADQAKADAEKLKPTVVEQTKAVADAKTELAEAEKKATPDTPGVDPTIAALARLLEPTDSPFDRLDRVNDWFMAYTTLILSAYGGDSRALNVTELTDGFKLDYQRALTARENGRRAYAGAAVAGLDRLSKNPAFANYVLDALDRLKKAGADDLLASGELKAARDNIRKEARAATSRDSIDFKLKHVTPLSPALGGETGNLPPPHELLLRVADPKSSESEVLATVEQAISFVAASRDQIKALDGVIKKLETRNGDTGKSPSAPTATPARQPEETQPEETQSAATQPEETQPTTRPAAAQYRLITLLLPVTIDAGTRSNTLVGNSMKVKCIRKRADSGSNSQFTWSPASADHVRVLSLHPQRNYDLEEQRLSQSFRDTTRLLATAGFSKGGGKIDKSSDRQMEEAIRFLSRVSKVGAWQDAGNRSFGWTFAPSNLRVVPRPVLLQVTDLFTGQPGRQYEAKASLETGSRLCSAILLVETSVDAVELELSSYTMDVERANVGGGRQFGLRATGRQPQTLRVDLPEHDPMENLILTLPQP